MKSKTLLSRSALLILGIIGEAPINPYAIVRLVNQKKRSLRRKVHAQTVYGIVNTLSTKKLITGKKIANGKLPNKTIYSITDKGKNLLRENLLSYLTTPEDNLSELALSMQLAGYLDKKTVLKALSEYLSKAGEEIAVRKKLGSFDISKGAYIQEIVVEHTLNTLEVNYNTVDNLIKRIEKDTRWGNISIPWWRNETLKTDPRK